MRVAIVQEHIDARRGGSETSSVEMARRLAALGLEVTIVCAKTTLDADHADPPSFRVRCTEAGGLSRSGRTMKFVRQADRICRAEAFDIVHAVTPCMTADVYQPRGGTYAETVARSVAMAGGPVAAGLKWLARRLNRRQRFLLGLERRLLSGPRPPMVAALSEYVSRQVRSAFPALPAERIRVVYNGVDIEPLSAEQAESERSALRARLKLRDGQALVLFVAHNFQLKGLAELIRACATPIGRSLDWVVGVAGRDKPDRFQRQAQRCGVAGRIHFLGPNVPVRSLYAAADVLAHPTWYDPCSRVVLEALCCGVPVVTTRFNGAAESIGDGTHGLVIDSPRQVGALADGIARCLEPALAQRCRAEAAAMRQRLSMARHARELEALYGEMRAAATARA